MLVLFVAFVSTGCCEGAERDNIFHVKYVNKMSLAELAQKLGENPFKMDAKTVASYLAQAKPKDRTDAAIGHLIVGDLLALAEIDTKKPMETCDRVQFLTLIGMCEQFYPFENVQAVKHHLSVYCKHSLEKRFEFCAGQIGKINELTNKETLFGEKLMEYSEEFSAWVDYDGDQNGTEKDNVVKFRQVNPLAARLFTRKCWVWNEILKEKLLFFDEDGQKTSAYFAADKEAALLRDRCRIIVEEDEAERKRGAESSDD